MTVTVTGECPPDDDDEASIVAFGLDAATHRAVRRAARAYGTTASVFLRAAVAILLRRLGADTALPGGHPAQCGLDLSGDPTTRDVLARARAADRDGRLGAEARTPFSLRRLLRLIGTGETPGPADRLKQVLVPMIVAPDLPISDIDVRTDAECRRRRRTDPHPVPPGVGRGPVPLSTAQRAVWAAGRTHVRPEADNAWWTVRLRGALDADALRAAARDVVGLHEPLRTRYPEHGGEPAQEILDADAVGDPLDVVDAAGGDVQDLLAEAVRRPFDLRREPPFRMVLFTAAPDSHVLLLLFHRIAVDPASQGPLLWDLQAAYGARRSGTAPAWPPLPVRYADVAARRHARLGAADDPRSRCARQRAYWAQALADLPQAVTPAAGPATTGGAPSPAAAFPAADSEGSGTVRAEIPAALAQSMAAFAREHGTTTATVFRSAVAVLLHRSGAGTDVPLGTLVSDRAEEEGLHDAVGTFLTPLVLRADLSGSPCFSDVVRRVSATGRAAREHADLPLDQVADAAARAPGPVPGRPPLFGTMASHTTRAERPRRLFGLDTAIGADGYAAPRCEWEFDAVEAPEEERTALTLRYAADRIDHATAESIVARLLRLLARAIAHPRRPIGDLETAPGEEDRERGRSAVILVLPDRSGAATGRVPPRHARFGRVPRDAVAAHSGPPHPIWRLT
ncbi:hypothetical protein HNR23_001445 [Nocardiopsis mwathae]|uniref:Condensation domain-containing protein n=1 Tax=Nocardiopsis mwathae TaxID=1472723 RepID=A0A7W9YFU4_9ACTN|nr:condensation domain-containing protein [Nocardiopsis mwathae]MBB6171385.1 hypothetical protein [Nocardiopsis mwathae]